MPMYPSVSDFWQYRCRRLTERLEDCDALKVLNHALWESYKEETRRITLSAAEGEQLEVTVYSVQQGPTRRNTFYDWQHIPDIFRQAQRLRAVHANLRCAAADSEADKVIGAVGVNLQELTLPQVVSLCEEMAEWWEFSGRTYLSPFSQMAYVMRNWLDGVYGEEPLGNHPSLDPLREIEIDTRTLVAECAKSIFSILKQDMGLSDSPEIGLVGVGAWAESAASELRSLGATCDRFDHLPVGRNREIYFLLHSENSLTLDLAGELKCRAVVEMLPGQINPEVDEVLQARGVVVVPDLVCASAQEIVEDWWIGGRRVPGWAMALFLKLSALWEEIRRRKAETGLCYHDVALMLALQRIAKRWNL